MTSSLTLTTDRLTLREYVADDWQATLAYQRDPRYLRFYSWTQRTEAEVQAFVDLFVAQQKEQPREKFQFALTQKSNGQLLGSGGIRVQNAAERQATVGYELDPHFWGNGFATEAARELLRFGFQTLGMHRIYGECITENLASIRVMEKSGMQQESQMLGTTWFKGRWWNSSIYAVLEEEWRTSYGILP